MGRNHRGRSVRRYRWLTGDRSLSRVGVTPPPRIHSLMRSLRSPPYNPGMSVPAVAWALGSTNRIGSR